jgi:hypothetical protein
MNAGSVTSCKQVHLQMNSDKYKYTRCDQKFLHTVFFFSAMPLTAILCCPFEGVLLHLVAASPEILAVEY